MFKVILVVLTVGNTVSMDTRDFDRMSTCQQILSSLFGTMLVSDWERVAGPSIQLTKNEKTVTLACIKEKPKR